MCRFPAVFAEACHYDCKDIWSNVTKLEVASSVAVHKNKSYSTIITYVNNIYHVMSCHFTMVSVRWVRHGVIFRLGWTNIHDMLFSVPILTVTILTLTISLTLTLLTLRVTLTLILTITTHRGWKIAWSISNYPSWGWKISSMVLISIRDGQIYKTGAIFHP